MGHNDIFIKNLSHSEDLPGSEKSLFKSLGDHSRIAAPFEALNPQFVEIGDYVSINREMKISVFSDITRITGYIAQQGFKPARGLDPADYQYGSPRVSIGNGCSFGRFCFITATSDIQIGDFVIFSDRVYISDTDHQFDDIGLPIMFQALSRGGKVSIGDHSWIGIGAAILNCSIGRHSVIGANSVVIEDIPDYTVAVGSPARPIKRYDPDSGRWEKINRNSS